MTATEHEFPSINASKARKLLEDDTSPREYMDNIRRSPVLLDNEPPFCYTPGLEESLRNLVTQFANTIRPQTVSDPTNSDDVLWFRSQVEFSIPWFTMLQNVPVVVQEDDGFWRYLTVCVLGRDPIVASRLKPVQGSVIDSHIGAMASNLLDEDGDSVDRSGDILAKRMFLRGRLMKSRDADSLQDDTTAEPNGKSTKLQQYVSWHEFETSHVFPGTALDGQPAWQEAIITAGALVKDRPNNKDGPNNTVIGRRAVKKINAARSARVSSITPSSACTIAKAIAEAEVARASRTDSGQ